MPFAKKFHYLQRYCLVTVLALLSTLLFHRGFQLYQAAQQPVDAVLVLGGSIRREIAVAQLASRSQLPVLISAGSPAPCLWSIFDRESSALEWELGQDVSENLDNFQGQDNSQGQGNAKSRTWLEPCARSTLGNYRFGLPILQGWGAHHVMLMTSGTHQLRATGLGRIILGSHGIWLSPSPVAETGRPGNQESMLKTALDWIRGLAWALVSQVYNPDCSSLMRLDQVVLEDWLDREFECEAQGAVELPAMFNRSDRL